MRKLKLYLETSVISFQIARPARELHLLVKQQYTNDWWETIEQYEVFLSQAVREEIEKGNPQASQRRLELVANFPLVTRTPPVDDLVEVLVNENIIPAKVRMDAVHIALAAVHELDFLVTWNQTHLANVLTRRRMEQVIQRQGFIPPQIVTPEELLFAMQFAIPSVSN